MWHNQNESHLKLRIYNQSIFVSIRISDNVKSKNITDDERL